MSIFKVLENNIEKSVSEYADYLTGRKADDLRGTEFMLYSLSSIFREKEMDELERGIVDSQYRRVKYDFGIDAIYISASNDLIETPDELEDCNEDTKFKIHIFQFKRGPGVAQADLLKLHKGIKKILIDESIQDSDNLYFFNRMQVLNEIKDRIFRDFSSENITVNCHIVFGGLEDNIYKDPLLSEELSAIEAELKAGGFTNVKIIVTDCQSLINAPTRSEEIVDIIEYQKTFKYITDTDSKNKLNGYISVVGGKDIAELVRKHQTSIFEANIRDYYRRNEINSKITETSSNPQEAKFFWSYNNGLTMTCSKVEEMPNNKYKLHNLQIVNGCQTSNAIYQAMKNKERVEALQLKQNTGKALTDRETQELKIKGQLQFNDSTTLLVKIIETNNEDFIYKITETTNSQTPIKAFSLKANDDVQKLIEKYLEGHGISYERRINHLRNKGKKNIYSIQKLFQLYTAQMLYKPSQVRTTPKRMFMSTYDDVFPSPNVKNMNFVFYLVPISVDIAINKAIKDMIKNGVELDPYQNTLLSYGKLHLGIFILRSLLGKDYNEKGIVKNETKILRELNDDYSHHFNRAFEELEKVVKNFGASKKETIPSTMRKKDLDARIVRFVKGGK